MQLFHIAGPKNIQILEKSAGEKSVKVWSFTKRRGDQTFAFFSRTLPYQYSLRICFVNAIEDKTI